LIAKQQDEDDMGGMDMGGMDGMDDMDGAFDEF
jgi:hypothetical protein